MRRLLWLAAFALAACASEPEPTEPVAPGAPIGDPMDPADSLLADSVNVQPAPGPIPDNTTLPDS